MFHFQSGRSMLEMLAVLAIAGIVTIGALAGYSYANSKTKANAIAANVNSRAVSAAPSVNLREATENVPFTIQGFEEKEGAYTYQLYKGPDKTFDVVVSPVSLNVCKRLKDIPLKEPIAIKINNVLVADATCQENNTFAFTYETLIAGRDTLSTPITCPDCVGCQSCNSYTGTCHDDDTNCPAKKICSMGTCICDPAYEECQGGCFTPCGDKFERDFTTCACVCSPENCGANKHWQAPTCSCVCDEGYTACKDNCYLPCSGSKLSGVRNATTCKCECRKDARLTDACECPANMTWNETQKMCVCTSDRQTWNETTKKCECLENANLTAACECPADTTWDAAQKMCVCTNALKTWNKTTKKCECIYSPSGADPATCLCPNGQGGYCSVYNPDNSCQTSQCCAGKVFGNALSAGRDLCCATGQGLYCSSYTNGTCMSAGCCAGTRYCLGKKNNQCIQDSCTSYTVSETLGGEGRYWVKNTQDGTTAYRELRSGSRSAGSVITEAICFPRANNDTNGYYLVTLNFFGQAAINGISKTASWTLNNVKVDLKNNVLYPTNLNSAQISIPTTTNYFYSIENGYWSGDYNSAVVKYGVSRTATTMCFYAHTFAYGEEDDYAHAWINYSIPKNGINWVYYEE